MRRASCDRWWSVPGAGALGVGLGLLLGASFGPVARLERRGPVIGLRWLRRVRHDGRLGRSDRGSLSRRALDAPEASGTGREAGAVRRRGRRPGLER